LLGIFPYKISNFLFYTPNLQNYKNILIFVVSGGFAFSIYKTTLKGQCHEMLVDV
jgi:hypothetical protein